MNGTDVMIECVGWTLLHFLWEGLVIAIVLGILLCALRKASANSRYWAGCVALALMITAPVGTYMQLAKQPAPAQQPAFQIQPESLPVEITPRIISPSSTRVVTTEQKKPIVKISWSERLTPLLPVLVAGWAMGVIVLALRLSAGWLRVKRLKRLGTESMEEVWHARLAELTRRLRINRSVRLVKSALVEVPTVIGWLRPIILMPAGCLTGLSTAQVEYILAHELAHVRRHDYLVNLLQCLAETILFYHPAVWWVSRRIREEREHCCDDVAVSVCGDRLEYARTLAALEELRGSQNQLVMAAAGAPLLQRIRRLAGQSERNPSHPAWPVAAIIILTLVATLGIGLRSSRAVADETQGSILKTSHWTTAIMKSDSQVQAEASARQGSSESQTQPQIHIEAKFIELDEKDFPKSIFNLPGASNAVSTSIKLTIPKHSSQVLANVTNSIVQSFTGILSEPDYRKALEAFKAAHSANILSSPSVVTEFGRQAQMFVGDEIPIPTTNSPTALVTLVPSGMMFDVIPTLLTNGTKLHLTTMATVTKLMGRPTTVPLPIEVAQLSTDAALEDCQTLVMGGFMPEVVTKMTDKVAVLGSIPLAGRLFRSESTSKSRKYLIVFVTPILINPDGSRYHSDKKDSAKASSTARPEALNKQSGLTLTQDENGTLDVFYESGKRDAAEDRLQETLKQLPLPNFTLRTNSGKTSPSSDPDAPQKQIAGALVQVGKSLFESGKSDAAEAKFQEALKLDPNNAPAGYYLGLIQQKRDHAGENRGELQVVHPMLKSDAAHGSDLRTNTQEALKQQLQLPNSFARSNVVYTSKGHQAILSKLDRIRVDSIKYDGLPLTEVIKNLSEIAKTRDPDRVGINFFINREAPAAVPGAIDPTTGLPTAAAALTTEPVDVGGVTVKIAPAMTDARLADVLDAITKTSDKPIKYSVEDYAVVFSLKGPETVPLFARVYHVDTNALLKAVGSLRPNTRNDWSTNAIIRYPNGPAQPVTNYIVVDRGLQVAIRNFFAKANIDFSQTNTGKSLFYNQSKAALTVHSTLQDLDRIEEVLSTINTEELNIQSKERSVEKDQKSDDKTKGDAQTTNIPHSSISALRNNQTNAQEPGGTDSGVGIRNRAPLVLSGNVLYRSGVGLDTLYSDAKDQNAVERIVQEIDALTPQTQPEENPVKTDERASQQTQSPAGVAKTNLVKAIKGRKEIIAALNRIHADSADYEGLFLWDAVKKLSQTTISKDPGYSGVNFFINREAPAQIPLQGGIDPSTGLPRSQPKDGDLGKIVLKPTHEQIDVPLIAILDSIATNNSLQYTIEEYAVVFSFKDERAPLYTRIYHVNSDAILKAVESYTNAIVLNPKEPLSTNFSLGDYKLQMALREFLSHSGLDFSPTNPANIGKSLFYKERKGILMVHSTSQDLDLIESVLGKLNPPRPYVQIKARFVEMDETAAAKINFAETMGGNGVKTNSIQTPVSLRKDPNLGSFPAVTNALAFQFTGVLTPEQYKEAITRLEKADGVDILTTPDVTTESGRQAQIQAVDIQTVVTGLTTVYTNGTAANIYSTQNLPFGPVLDVIPKVSADYFTIEMNLVANVTEFLGYDDPKKLKGQKRTDVQIPLPHFRLRQLTSSIAVWDGQTIVLGGVEATSTNKRGKGKQKTLIVFVTPTIRMADGNVQQAALKETK